MTWLRKVSLLVTQGADALDLSEMHIKFRVSQADTESPNSASIRVYNLSSETAQKVQEFGRVVLQAGYEDGAFGVIFDGTIMQFRRGKENATDTFLDIMAADGDVFSNFCTVNATLAAGHTPQDVMKAVSQAPNGAELGYVDRLPQTQGIRGKVLFGSGRDILHNTVTTIGASWSIQDGKVQVMALHSYLPGEAVQLNSKTGLIGIPEQVEDGINARCLLNPRLTVGALVQINNADITTTTNTAAGVTKAGSYTALSMPYPLSRDGFYRLYVVEHEGDSRGREWYSTLVCLAVEKDAGEVVQGA